MVRGSVVLMTTFYIGFKKGAISVFGYFSIPSPKFDVITAGAIVGLVCFAIGYYSTFTVPETHNKDLDFLEE